jgi:hypothetical protein
MAEIATQQAQTLSEFRDNYEVTHVFFFIESHRMN